MTSIGWISQSCCIFASSRARRSASATCRAMASTCAISSHRDGFSADASQASEPAAARRGGVAVECTGATCCLLPAHSDIELCVLVGGIREDAVGICVEAPSTDDPLVVRTSSCGWAVAGAPTHLRIQSASSSVSPLHRAADQALPIAP
eukprot:CAMPEP_0171222432 /NCGR_PEP_ID=MMETSP0790-20130122/35260_1 /TAXON_ID=2925 /ORGANISM="Alexandrium catenella, Strain OF101" /LENGTH=148 /DNA_ID=CAMNT_0011688377 /DNA_START=144 /DNA_END=586 /DNA_ORIENTATION=+